MNLRVLVLGVRGMPNVQGGVETHAEHLYARLAERGCDVQVIVRSPFTHAGVSRLGRIRLKRLWAPRRQGLEALVHSFLGVLYAAWYRPDVLHIHAIGPAIVTPLARLFGLRVIVTHHGQDYRREKWGVAARWLLRIGELFGVRLAHACIAISGILAEELRQRFGRPVSFIPNGVVLPEPCLETSLLHAHGLQPGRYFLMVSRVVPEKRQLDLMRAFAAAAIPGWKLVLVGQLDGSRYANEVEQAAWSTGAVLAGYQTGASLAQLYTHAGVFVLPSSHEGLPIAALEALSYGLPVCASDIPANLAIGLDPSSYFRLGDIEALAAQLQRLASLPADPAAVAARRAWVADRFDWQRIAEQTLQVYEATARVMPA